MNLLMVGGGAGSWTIRGHQLGAALGARVTSTPTAEDWAWADVIVLVKRAILVWDREARASGKPIVWDALDFWVQPDQNGIDARSAVALAMRTAARVDPALIVCATQAMAEALDGVYLPHHAWPGLTPAPARSHVTVVGYQGNASYLGRWAGWVTEACRTRGWQFRINPDDLREVDILVAFRDGPWDGWICREWKSGVKLVNARQAGRPIIAQPSAAFREIQPDGTTIESHAELDAALDRWSGASIRSSVVEMSSRYPTLHTVNQVAAAYRGLLQGVGCPA